MSTPGTRTMPNHARWFVVCEDFEMGPFSTEETAERHRADAIKMDACHFEHTVVRRDA